MKNKKYLRINHKVISLSTAVILMASGVAYGAEPIKKDESVYVNLTAEGEHKQTIVTDWLHSDRAGIEIKDRSTLESITNLKGDETPSIENGVLTWNTDKNDIHYQGVTNEAPPLEVKIDYFLDGKKISPQDLAGKSGKIRIVIRFENKDGHNVNLNGKTRKIYTPFLASGIVNLPTNSFENVEVTGGKVVNDANNQVVTFVAFPGLQESLDIDRDVIDIPEDITIEAETNKFEIGSIMIVATPKIPEMDSLDDAENLDELTDGLEKIEDATGKLTEGSNELADGQSELAEGIDTFYKGMGQLKDGSGALNSGVSQFSQATKSAVEGSGKLKNGVTSIGKGAQDIGNATIQYSNGAQEYAKGAKEFAKGASKFSNSLAPLTDGMKELIVSLNTMAQNTGDLAVYQDKITQGARVGAESLDGLKTGKAKQDEAINGVIAGLDKTINSLKTNEEFISDPNNEQTLVELTSYKKILEEVQKSGGQISEGLNKLQNAFLGIEGGSRELSDNLKKMQEAQSYAAEELISKSQGAEAGITEAVKTFNDGATGLNAGADELTKNAKLIGEGANTFKSKSKELSAGFDEFSDGIGKLNEGASSLSKGTSELDKGLGSAYDGASSLKEGSEKLAEGGSELATNMNKFKEEAIDKIDEEFNDKTDNLDDILKAKDEIVKLSDDYGTFSGLHETMEGSVKFIMKTDAIEIPETKEVEKVEETQEQSGFINWIKNLFNR